MHTTIFDFLIFIALFLCLYHGTGNAFTIDISPSHVNGLVHNEVSMTCRLDNSDADVKEIMVLELSRNDVAIALLRSNTPLTVGKGTDLKFQASGNVSSKAVYDSYIQVTISDPEVTDSGSYTCLMYFLNQAGILHETRQSSNLTVSDQDMKSAITYLVDKVSGLEDELQERRNVETKLQAQITSLTNQNTALRSQLASQDAKDQILQHKIDELIEVTKCPQDWHFYKNSETCIKACTEKASFSTARQTCQDAGGDLVKVDSLDKNRFVEGLFHGDFDSIWIGIWDQHHNREFTYTDGSHLSYSHWLPGQPDNAYDTEDCVHILESKGGVWNDITCSYSYAFACEMPVRMK